MELGPVTKRNKRNKKKIDMSCWQIVTSLSFFQFMVNWSNLEDEFQMHGLEYLHCH